MLARDYLDSRPAPKGLKLRELLCYDAAALEQLKALKLLTAIPTSAGIGFDLYLPK